MLDVIVTFHIFANCLKILALTGRDSMPGAINFRHFLLFITIAAAIFCIDCSGDQEPTYVDFSDKMVVDRSGDESRDKVYLKVAVGSIISAQETVVYYHQLLEYIAAKLGREIQLVQRKTYGEINELIGMGQIDLAFICSGPYAGGREKFGFQALAMPRVRGSHLYQAYLIVNKDSPFQKLDRPQGQQFSLLPIRNQIQENSCPPIGSAKRAQNPRIFSAKPFILTVMTIPSGQSPCLWWTERR